MPLAFNSCTFQIQHQGNLRFLHKAAAFQFSKLSIICCHFIHSDILIYIYLNSRFGHYTMANKTATVLYSWEKWMLSLFSWKKIPPPLSKTCFTIMEVLMCHIWLANFDHVSHSLWRHNINTTNKSCNFSEVRWDSGQSLLIIKSIITWPWVWVGSAARNYVAVLLAIRNLK